MDRWLVGGARAPQFACGPGAGGPTPASSDLGARVAGRRHNLSPLGAREFGQTPAIDLRHPCPLAAPNFIGSSHQNRNRGPLPSRAPNGPRGAAAKWQIVIAPTGIAQLAANTNRRAVMDQWVRRAGGDTRGCGANLCPRRIIAHARISHELDFGAARISLSLLGATPNRCPRGAGAPIGA